MENKLVIIDGSSLLYRAFYALPPLSKNGVYTNAVFGFLRMLLSIYRTLDPEYMAVSFDKSRETFRTKMYSEYKATRKPAPDELVPQFALIKEVLRVMGVAVYEPEGYEGDDVLGTLSRRYEDSLPVYIVTGDRDALQLSDEHVTVLLTRKGISQMDAMTPEAVMEKYQITPSQVIDMKALMGDASDNIPGVRGVGEKTALKLITRYKTLDGIYDHLDEIKGALHKKLEADKEAAYLSYDLATIRRDIPLESTLDEMKQPVHLDEMNALFRRLGMDTMVSEFSRLPRFEALAREKKEQTVTQIKEAEPWSEDISVEGETLALVIPFTGTAPFLQAPFVMIVSHDHVWRAEKEQFPQVQKVLSKAAHVVVTDSKKLWESDFPLHGLALEDISLSAYVLNPGRTDYPLSYLAEFCGIDPVYPEQMETPEESGAVTGTFLLSVYAHLVLEMEKNGVDALYRNIELPLVEVLAAMEKAGIATDQKRWKEVLEDMQQRERYILREIYTEAGESFNVNSPRQLSYILFDKMHMPAGKKTKTGYSTAASVLDKLAETYPFVKKILEYRTLSKLISTYLLALPELIRPETGRIHTSFNQTVTATGRLSSSNPNLQNIPVRTEEGRKIRSLFVPGEGYDCFISSDYSQVELRVLAHMSGDPGLIAAFNNKEDIHRRTAAEIMGIPFEEVTPEQRSHAKAVNFGIIYGISDYGLARQLNISREAAARYMKSYFERYPHIHEYMQTMIEQARNTGRAVTMFGRYRELPDIHSKNFNRRSFAERTAMNTPIQGTAADIMKIAMRNVYKKMQAMGCRSRILLQVHDELIVEAVNSEKEMLEKLLKETMEQAVKLRVPLVADVHTGTNWAETK
ncbi:DNA polymerase I [Allisonella histaminiformans]|uniref:DNA polymerase I n=1 Tax=Allisonella histaminiformans TaxID=209880 RepID=UPI002409599B|nr:DNA polymerase I [Allisonella histaminiformans]MDD6870862.1 DNA polymerase I [Allisonella histaminiformans]